jgi:hypothetical protein
MFKGSAQTSLGLINIHCMSRPEDLNLVHIKVEFPFFLIDKKGEHCM